MRAILSIGSGRDLEVLFAHPLPANEIHLATCPAPSSAPQRPPPPDRTAAADG